MVVPGPPVTGGNVSGGSVTTGRVGAGNVVVGLTVVVVAATVVDVVAAVVVVASTAGLAKTGTNAQVFASSESARSALSLVILVRLAIFVFTVAVSPLRAAVPISANRSAWSEMF